MGSSPFEAASFDVALDEGCGMGFSAVHKVRAAACKALEEAILAPYEERAKTLELPVLDKCTRPMPKHYRDEPQICATVTSLEAAEAARAEGATRIYMTTDALEAVGLSPADAFEQGIVPVLDEVCRAVDHERVDPWINAGATVAVGNISELAVAAHAGATAEIRSCLPVHNTPCMEALAERGAGAFWLSPEITGLDEIVSLGTAAPAALGITVFGRPRVMTSEHCILQVANGCIHDCANCRLRARKLSLKNIDGKVMPVRTDIHGRSRLYDAYPIDLTPQVPQLLDAGVRRLMVDGTLLETDEVGRAVARRPSCRRSSTGRPQARRPPARRHLGLHVCGN